MADIGSLIVKISADASGLQKAFDQLGGSARQFQSGLARIEKVGLTAFVAVAAAATAMTVVAGKQAESLVQLSAITGINTDTLQQYDVMLNRVGLDGDALVTVFRTLSTNLEQAKNGVGNAGDRFRQLGINIRTVTSTDDLLRKIANSVSTFASGTEKAAIVADLLGRSGLKFLPAFEGGAKAIDHAAAASKTLGETLSTFQIGTLNTMDDSIDDMSIAWKRFGQQVGAVVAPSVDLVVRILTEMLAVGSHVFRSLDTAADTLAIRFSHVALAINEVASTLFSSKVLSGEAWKQTVDNLKMIDAEAAKLIAKRRAIDSIGAPADLRAKPPALIDTSKISQQQQALIDAQLKANEGLFKNEDALAKARLTNYLATLEASKAAGIRTDEEVALAKQAALEQMDVFTADSLTRQLRNYQTFAADKMKLFTSDEKGQADRTKFAVEASQKERDLINQVAVAQVVADTTRVQSGAAVLEATKKTRLIPLEDEMTLAKADFELQRAFYASAPGLIGAAGAAREKGLQLIQAEADIQHQVIEQTIKDEERKQTLILALDGETQAKRIALVQQFPTFWEKQMRDVVSSNAFSVSQIITSWTSGVAGAIVNGGDFVKQAWQSTQLALVQGALNTGVQLAAQWALQAAVEMEILTVTEASKLGLKTATNAAIVAEDAAAATATVGIWGGAAAAITGFFAATSAAFTAMIANMVAIVTAVGTWIEGVLTAIAAALTETIFGIPWAGAILAGIALIAIALAATGNLGFKEGGIGDFGSGTKATLHGPEAIIPLNQRGADFMREAFGGGEGKGQIIHTHVLLNGREIASAMSDELPGALRTMGAF